MDGTKIQWTDATWQVSYGCTRVDHRCDNCYAMHLLHRGLSPMHRGLTKHRGKDATRPGIDWNGQVRLAPHQLDQPLRWKRPRRVFVDSLSDLFHLAIPIDYLAEVFAIMALAHRHTFQVLTKRPARAAVTTTHPGFRWAVADAAKRWGAVPGIDPEGKTHDAIKAGALWPLPNVHLGCSVSDQPTFDADVPMLLKASAAVLWLSIEPLLGPIDIDRGGRAQRRCECNAGSIPCDGGGRTCMRCDGTGWVHGIDWIVVGGESGPGSRPCDLAWVRSIVEQCQRAGVPCFVKQGGTANRCEHDSKGGHLECLPEDIRVREFPHAP